MTSYYITINEKAQLGKSLVAYLQSIPQIATLEKTKQEPAEKSWLYHELESAFADVRLMMDGKKRKKSLDELIDELRKEQANELCDSSN
jgi:hypothetical protein